MNKSEELKMQIAHESKINDNLIKRNIELCDQIEKLRRDCRIFKWGGVGIGVISLSIVAIGITAL